jgi:hypothetical protein
LILSAASTDAEKQLFDMLRGGGFGICAILSVTLRIYKTEPLSLEDGDKVVAITAMFPAPHFDSACELFTSLTPVSDPRASITCMITNAPPNMPLGGAPIMILSVTFIGNVAAAKTALAPLFTDEVARKAIAVMTTPTEVAHMNDQIDRRFKKLSGYTDVYNGMMVDVSAKTIMSAVQKWMAFRNEVGADVAGKTMTAVASFCTVGLKKADPIGERGACHRDRSFLGQCGMFWLAPDEVEPVKAFAAEWISTLREDDELQNRSKAAYPNNLRVGTDMREVYDEQKMADLILVKKHWDSDGVFWNPAVNGWS